MQVILEKPVDNPDRTDRTNIFGIHEYSTTYNSQTNTQTTRLYWPYHSALEVTEHTARPIAGTNIAHISIDTLTELMLQPHYAANTVLILGQEYNTINRALPHITDQQKEDMRIINQDETISTTENDNPTIDFFNTTGDQ